MKKVRFVFVTVVIALLLGSFFAAPATQKSAIASEPNQSIRFAAIPAFSPFFIGAGAQIVAAGGVSPQNNTIGYSCLLTAQTPADWTTMKGRTSFDAAWTLKNTGTKVWGMHGVDIVYRSGTKMHTGVNLADMPRQVGVGQKITIKADMIAPKLPGYYVENWGLNLGNLTFCKFYIVIYVSG